MLKYSKIFSGILILIFSFFNSLFSQCINVNATLRGVADINLKNEYIITPNKKDKVGAIWTLNKVNLNEAFIFEFNIFLGSDDNGADGIAFVIRPEESSSFGITGSGLSYEGIKNSFAVEFDTYSNIDEKLDPRNDHTGIQIGGTSNHSNLLANLFGPFDLGNIKIIYFTKLNLNGILSLTILNTFLMLI